MLSVLCFSLVPVLRCVALGRIEFSTLLIPPGIEVLFSIALLFKRADNGGRYHLLLSAEGISYFLLALTDFLTHIVAALHRDHFVVKLVDLLIGGLSAIPLLFFTLWFFFTAQEELLYILPGRLRKLTKYFLLGWIPLIIASNAVGAVIGISYKTDDGVTTIGFNDERRRMLWSLLNILSLALLTVFEAVAFFLLLARFVKTIRHKKRRVSVSGSGEVHHCRGIIYMNFGMLLSLAETPVGFFPQDFILAIIRRGVKSAGRVFIMIGLLMGWDYIEDIRFVLQEPPAPRRISKMSIRQFFRRSRPPNEEMPTIEHPNARVSVRQARGRAPTLHLRLSEFEVSPIFRAFRTPSRSPSSIQIHLIPQTPHSGSSIEFTTKGHLDVPSPRRGNNTPTSPLNPNSSLTVPGQPPGMDFSSGRAAGLQPSASAQDEDSHHLTHMREDTVSSTMSHLQVEVMSLSESPPDPGFVLPIPSRSRAKTNFNLPPDNRRLSRGSTRPTRTTEREFTRDSAIDFVPPQLIREAPLRRTPPVNDVDPTSPLLNPPRPRQPSQVSVGSDASTAVISTARKLRRAHTTANVTSLAPRRSSMAIPNDGHRGRQQLSIVGGHPLGSGLSSVHTERREGDTV